MTTSNSYEAAKDEIKDFIDRYREMLRIISEAKEDMKNLMQEMKSAGYDTKAIREVVKILENGVDPEKENFEMIVETYLKAVQSVN